MSRSLLHISKLDAFKSWLDSVGIEHRPPRGDWQVLQVSLLKNQWACVYYRAKMPEHYTVDTRIEYLVRRFIAAEHQGWKPPEPAMLPIQSPTSQNGFDENGPMFDTGWYIPSEGHPGYKRTA